MIMQTEWEKSAHCRPDWSHVVGFILSLPTETISSCGLNAAALGEWRQLAVMCSHEWSWWGSDTPPTRKQEVNVGHVKCIERAVARH